MTVKSILKGFAAVFLAAGMLCSCLPGEAPENSPFVKTEGTGFVLNGAPYEIKSVAVAINGDNVMEEDDYRTISELGFNAIRLHWDYSLLESDSDPYIYLDSGWELLDDQISYARKHGIKVIINMHFPQGGYQSSGQGTALWTEEENQNRLVEMWGAIARRYAGDETVLGYGIVNEPTPRADNLKVGLRLWSELSQRITGRIRKEDQNHVIFLERANGIADPNGVLIPQTFGEEYHYGFPESEDQNTAYEFHFYDPYAFTSQITAPQEDSYKPYLCYPNQFVAASENPRYAENIYRGPAADLDNYEVQTIVGEPVRYDGESPAYFQTGISCVSSQVGGGVLLYGFRVKEYNEQGEFIGEVLNLTMKEPETFYIWSPDYSFSSQYDETKQAAYIENAAGNFSAVLNEANIPMKKGHSYQVEADLSLYGFAPGSQIAPFMNRYDCDSYSVLDKEYLLGRLEPYIQFGQQEGRPLFVGEFGLSAAAQDPARGGLQWVSDVKGILEEAGLSYSYFAYNDVYYPLNFENWKGD